MGEALEFIEKYGHSPWNSPSWNDDWKRELRSNEASKAKRNSSTPQFETFCEASDWARRHPGRTISRSPDGNGFIVR